MNAHAPQSCATCAKADCHLSFVSRRIEPVTATTAFIVDEIWPEYRDFVTEHAKAGDQILSPGLPGLARYRWAGATPSAVWATLNRHVIMRRVARARGSVRQAAYLKSDEALAMALARRIDYRARHLVVYQAFLPFLWREGMLGGRTFDVLMTRYPLAALHARLDAVMARQGGSRTIGDFRAPDALVEAEAKALAAARRIVTPHHDIAERAGDRALWLDWKKPEIRRHRAGERVAFLGPVIARQGAHTVRDMARHLPEPLIVFGAELEGADFWGDIPIERRTMGPGWLDDIGAILHPAAVTHQPRRLIEAVAHGVKVFAEPSCGLAPGQFQPVASFSA